MKIGILIFCQWCQKALGAYISLREGYFVARYATMHKQIFKFNPDHELFKVLYLPPNVTSVQQPMDQGIICSFKLLYKVQVLNHILIEEIKSQEDLEKTIKEYNIRDCIFDVSKAWDSIKNKALITSWKCLINESPNDDSFIEEILNTETILVTEVTEIVDCLHSLLCHNELILLV